jgi:hypothetical protein
VRTDRERLEDAIEAIDRCLAKRGTREDSKDLLEILGREPRFLRDPREHLGTDFDVVVKRKRGRLPSVSLQGTTRHPMRFSAANTRLALVALQLPPTTWLYAALATNDTASKVSGSSFASIRSASTRKAST